MQIKARQVLIFKCLDFPQVIINKTRENIINSPLLIECWLLYPLNFIININNIWFLLLLLLLFVPPSTYNIKMYEKFWSEFVLIYYIFDTIKVEYNNLSWNFPYIWTLQVEGGQIIIKKIKMRNY